MKQQPAKGSTAKHAGTSKQASSKAKHTPSKQRAAAASSNAKKTTGAKAAHPQHAKARQLSPGQVACCAAEAVAASLRLTGCYVSTDDVLTLYWHTAAAPGDGASILGTLAAAARVGLAGVRPRWFAPVDHAVQQRGGVILGAELPGPHAVTVDGGHWLSWGSRWLPSTWPDAAVEEAWQVAW